MSRAKIIIIAIACIAVIVLGVIAGLIISENGQKNAPKITYTQSKKNTEKNELTNKQKEIAGVSKEKTIEEKAEKKKEENYSEVYKEYLNFTDKQKEETEVVPREETVEIDKLQEIKKYLAEGVVPEKFNLADAIDIKIDNQGQYGLCWAFASMNSLETHLALNEDKNYDFSEMHLNYVESDLMYGYRNVHTGGNFEMFKDYLSLSGVVLEKDVPYREYTESEYEKFIDMKPVKIVTETIDFPSYYKNEYSTYTEEEIKDFRETVKKHIMQNGGLYCVIATPDYGTRYFNQTTSSECFLGDYNDLQDGRAFHAVTLIGWDDNYSKDNFNEGMRPKNNGAYIFANSWGEGYGNKGYYYISYEDKYVESDLSGIVSTSLKDAYKLSDIQNKPIRDYIEENFESRLIVDNGEKYATKSLLSTITSLDLSGRGMTSLSGIEIFTDAYTIDLSNNKISNLANIVNLDVGYIDLSNNNISDVSPIANMKRCPWGIILSNNNIKDVSVLANLGVEENYKYEIDLSGNSGVKGYGKLINANEIHLENCNITDVEDLSKQEYVYVLDLSNNPNINTQTISGKNIYEIKLNNCDIDDESISKIDLNKTYTLKIAQNNIKSFDWIKNAQNLSEIDVSDNSIGNWEGLIEYLNNKAIVKVTEEYEEYTDEYYDIYFRLVANNCGIEDISMFNECKISELIVKNNSIKDVSNFANEYLWEIDLSGNKDITGISKLNKIGYIILNNCNITNLDEIEKLDKVNDLSLENNNITSLGDLSNLKQIYSLSLAGNKNLTGTLKIKNLETLNLENCDIDDKFDLSGISNLYCLNLKGNPRIVDLAKLIKPLLTNGRYLYLVKEQISYNDFIKIKEINDNYISFDYDTELVIDQKLGNNNLIEFKGRPKVEEFLKKSWGNNTVENGKIDLKKGRITVDNVEEGYVKIKTTKYIEAVDGLRTIVFEFGTKPVKTEANTVDEISNVIENKVENQVIANTIKESNVENVVNEIVEEIVENVIEEPQEQNIIEEDSNIVSEI